MGGPGGYDPKAIATMSRRGSHLARVPGDATGRAQLLQRCAKEYRYYRDGELDKGFH